MTELPVAEEDRTGYDRDAFRHWIDEDKDRCDTRKEVLMAEATMEPTQGEKCWLDRLTARGKCLMIGANFPAQARESWLRWLS